MAHCIGWKGVVLVPITSVWRKDFVGERPAGFLKHLMLFRQLSKVRNIPTAMVKKRTENVLFVDSTEQSRGAAEMHGLRMMIELWTAW